MPNILTSFTAINSTDIALWNKQGNQATGSSAFDASLTNADSQANAKELADAFIQNIMRSLDNILNNVTKQKSSTVNAFPFSGDFEATFGTSGPLLDFINITTSKLNLTAKQNLALQDIAVRNKDITATPANIQKIANELKQAGIT